MEVVAQSVRASDCGSEGRGFDPLHPPHFLKSAPIKALFLYENLLSFVIFNSRCISLHEEISYAPDKHRNLFKIYIK